MVSVPARNDRPPVGLVAEGPRSRRSDKLPSVSPPAPQPSTRSAWLVFGLLFAVYCANGGFLLIDDAKVNMLSAVSLLNEGNFSITPREMPLLFDWEERPGLPPLAATDNAQIEAAIRRGDMTFRGPPYYLAESRIEGEYVLDEQRSLTPPLPLGTASPAEARREAPQPCRA
jgi:hypothetical protein